MPTSTNPESGTGPRRRGTGPVAELRRFLSAAMRNPGLVGACAPSSQALADRMASVVPTGTAPTGTAPTVVELGAGTGVFTRRVLRRAPAEARILAVERDPSLAAYLGDACPGAEVVHGDASELRDLLAARGVSEVDVVLCGLPWSLFSDEHQRTVLGEIAGVLAPHGVFTTFAYAPTRAMPGARRFRALLDETFAEVCLEPVVWRNLPPAATYRCAVPRPVADR